MMGDVCILFNEPLSRDADMLLTICDYESGIAMDILPKGLFIWARSTGLARFPRSRLATLFFVKISMCSYERPGWPGYRYLGFCDRDHGNRDEIFPNEYSSPVTGANLFKQNSVALRTYRPKWHNFGLVCISSLGVCELALLVKLQDSTMLWQSRTIPVYVLPFWLCFLNSLRSTGLKFPIWTHHRIRPGSQPGYRAHMKRPLDSSGWSNRANDHLGIKESKRVQNCMILM